MSTTDGNGIVFLEETDNISPFHTLINGMQQGTSDAFTELKEELALDYLVANLTSPPSTSSATSGNGTLVPWTTVSNSGITQTSGVVTIPTTGLYQIDTSVLWQANASGARLLRVMINSTFILYGTIWPTTTVHAAGCNTSGLLPLEEGDTVQVYARQNSGTTLNLTNQSNFSIYRVR